MKQSYSRYFPTPSYLAMNSCALDISDQSIKYGELLPTQQGLRLGRFGHEKIPVGVIDSGKIQDEQKLVAILKNLKERERLHFVRVSLPEEQMYLFTLSIPEISGSDLRDAILLQIEEHIPLSAFDVIFDYVVISSTPTTKIVEVVAIATITVENYLSAFEQAGLVPLSFELEAQAIARAVVPKGDNSSVMIVDFGEARTGISILQNELVSFTTTLDIGGNNLTSMIAKNFSLTQEKAEEMKLSYGLGGDSDVNEIFPVILNGISVLRDEINKHYVYWKTHSESGASRDIDRIILCGGDANLSGLAEYLQSSMGVKVEHANAWSNISSMSVSVPDMSLQESLGYVTVLGLALADYNYGSKSILSVLPKEQKSSLRREYHMRFLSVLFSLIALSGLLATVLLFPSYFFSISKSNLSEQRLESFNLENPEIATRNLDKTITNINNKLVLLSRSQSSEYPVYEKVIDNLLASKTQGIIFSQILYGQTSLTTRVLEVHGKAQSRDALSALKSSLEANPNFTEVNLPISNFIKKSDINFTITIKMK